MSKKDVRKEDGMDLLMRAFMTGSSSDAILSQDRRPEVVCQQRNPTDRHAGRHAVCS